MWFSKTAARKNFQQWVKQHHKALYRHALWMCGDASLAEDMVQETYFQAWQSYQHLKDERKALAWLLTILRRVVYREYGHKAKQQNLQQHIQNMGLVEFAANKQGEYLDVLQALEKMNINQREALLLHGLHGYSYEDISQQLDVPIGTVMSRISRARKILQPVKWSDDNNVLPFSVQKKV